MTGKLDEISQAIGGLQANTAGLKGAFDKHCIDDDRRHLENIAEAREQREELRQVREELATLNKTLSPFAEWAKSAKPQLEAMQISRWKVAGAVTLAGAILAGVAWAIGIAAQLVRSLFPGH